MRLPPQNQASSTKRAAIQGQEWGVASSPPTILVSTPVPSYSINICTAIVQFCYLINNRSQLLTWIAYIVLCINFSSCQTLLQVRYFHIYQRDNEKLFIEAKQMSNRETGKQRKNKQIHRRIYCQTDIDTEKRRKKRKKSALRQKMIL